VGSTAADLSVTGVDLYEARGGKTRAAPDAASRPEIYHFAGAKASNV